MFVQCFCLYMGGVGRVKATNTKQMKSTKVQNPWRVESCELCQCVCAEIGHASRFVAATRGAGQFSLQGPAASFWAKAECC